MDNNLDERERRLVANCCAYAAGDPAGLPGHNLMIVVAKLKAQVDAKEHLARKGMQALQLESFLETSAGPEYKKRLLEAKNKETLILWVKLLEGLLRKAKADQPEGNNDDHGLG